MVDDYPVLIASGSEKMLNVPGLCISWLMAFDPTGLVPNIREGISNATMIFLHTPVFLQQAVTKILPLVGTSLAEKCREVDSQALADKVSQVKGLTMLPRQGTFYAAVQVDIALWGCKTDVEWVDMLRSKANVYAMPLSLFGKRLCGFRMPICLSREAEQDLIRRLQNLA